jgi:hypothetical protein
MNGKLFIVCLFFLVSGCSVVTVQSELAPNTTISRADPLYLDIPAGDSIAYQKYVSALKEAISEAGINTVTERSTARYVMSLGINEFSAPIVRSVPNLRSTSVTGNMGAVPISGNAITYSTSLINSSIPTHNSQLVVIDASNGHVVWTGLLAKSYEVASHPELRKMLDKLLSLYGRDDKTSVMVGDEMRW